MDFIFVVHMYLYQGYWCPQDPPSPTNTSGDDVFLSPSWQPWPSQGRTENRQWGQFHESFNVQNTETPSAYGGYPAFFSPQQDLLLHE
jgi:DCN1-like protein 1/2